MTIVSSDKDLMQLIDDNTLMFDPQKKEIGKESVFEKFGIIPKKLLMFKRLREILQITFQVCPVLGLK